MRFRLALGGGEGERWLHLPELRGFAELAPLLAPRERFWLRDLHAHSPRGTLEHPGEVPVAGQTSLEALGDTLEAALGAPRRIALLRCGLEGGSVLHLEEERGARLEAEEDAALAERLARLSGARAAHWRLALGWLRDQALTGRYVDAAVDGEGIVLSCGGERAAFGAALTPS